MTACHAIFFALRSPNLKKMLINLKPSESFIFIYPELCFYIMINRYTVKPQKVIIGKSKLSPMGKIGNVLVLKCGC